MLLPRPTLPLPSLFKATIVCGLLAAALVLPNAAAAQTRTVPEDFFSMNWDVFLAAQHSQASQDAQFARMASSGVESVRAAFAWAYAQPQRHGPISFAVTDNIVELAVAHNLPLLPTVTFAPRWARQSSAAQSPPKYASDYAAYLTALIGRYGPSGSFWSEHPSLTAMPIRYWQIWNEENLQWQWTIPRGQDYAPQYVHLLQVSYRAVKQADPGARVVMGGVANNTPAILDHLYKHGIHGYFDVIDLHPYTTSAREVYRLVSASRAKMRAHGDGSKPLWVGELGLPASKGRDHSNNPVQTTDSGMAAFLKASYVDLIRGIHSLGVTRVYWYDWASGYKDKKGNFFDYAGLFQWRPNQSAKARPAYRTFLQLARQYEGCQKTSTAECAQPNPYGSAARR
jgi:hypothetical protein